MEKKFLASSFLIEEVDETVDEGYVKGYASVFGNIDLGLDVVEKGAFTSTLKQNKGKIPILADHDPRKQIGFNVLAKEDSKGLYVEGVWDIKNNQLARERFSLAKMAKKIGADFGFSIGYYTIKSEPSSENPSIRLLKELRLVEYSSVVFPMNPSAGVTGVKQFNDAHDEAYTSAIANLIKKGHTKEEILSIINQEYKKIKEPSAEEVHSMIETLKKAKNIFN